MSTKRAKTPAVEPDEDLLVEQEQNTLDYFIEAFGDDATKVEFYRVNPATAAEEFIGATPDVRTVDAEYVSQFGPGKYRVRLKQGSKFKKEKTIVIGQSPRTAVQTSAQPQAPAAEDPRVVILMDELKASRALLEKLLTQGANGAGSNDQVMAIIRAAREMAQLAGGGGSASVSPTQLFDIFQKGMEMAKEFGGGDGENAFKLKLLETIKDTVPELAAAVGDGIARARGGRPSGAPAPAGEGRVLIETMVRRGIAYLKPKAAKNSDVGLWIDLIMDEIDKPVYVAVVQAVLKTSFEEFAKMDPDLAAEPYASWFRKLHEGVIDAYAELRGEDNPGGGGGDESDAPSDAATGTAGRLRPVPAKSSPGSTAGD